MPEKETTVILVFACSYNVKSGLMDQDTISRLEKALSIWRRHPSARFLISGGVINPKIKSRSIAQDMYDWLIGQEVPEIQIMIELDSKDTRENLLFSLPMIQQGDSESNVFLASNRLHLWRIRYLLSRLKFQDNEIAKMKFFPIASDYLSFWSVIWEIGAWLKVLLKASRREFI